MSGWLSLLRSLRHDRTYVFRLLALILFVAVNLLTVITLHFKQDDQLQNLKIINLVSGIVITLIFIYGAIDLAKRNRTYEKVKNEREKLNKEFTSSQDLLFRIDHETRIDVGSWLHGTLQPQLTRLAKHIREEKETDCYIIAQQVDDITEKFVRTYSHNLYPPSLIVSLEVGLETLLEGRAELTLDQQLTNESNIGFSVWSSEPGFQDSTRPLRLVLGRERRYAAYRIIEEAVANAEKKSSTSQIFVDVRVEGEQIRISVCDNGAPISEKAKRGLGHSIIDTFVQQFDGNWSFANVVDGVELIALIPYLPITVAETLSRRFTKGD
jgi:signal transduction histidine kinase